MSTTVASIDIGSTYTKAALFDLAAENPRLLRRCTVATTVERLGRGFDEAIARLLEKPLASGERPSPADIPAYACSSAKGGLAIAAVGIVPDLTLHAARLAAASAGGRIVAHYSYYLTPDHIADLERQRPDIVLFCGGTDGGNEEYNLRNARALAAATNVGMIIYAGNGSICGQIRETLAGKDLIVTDNLLPEVDHLAIEPAQACIQQVFLERIIEGKGLAEVRARCQGEIKPTPRAVFDLLGALDAAAGQWGDSVWIDLGGATTDCYSCTDSFRGEAGFVLRGPAEPRLKRTVEGDLGLRVSAPAVVETAAAYLRRELAPRGMPPESLAAYAAKVNEAKQYLPNEAEEGWFDELLAQACIYHALLRHAGSVEESYLPSGKVHVQRGKDLRGVRRWIGSGGYLAWLASAAPGRAALAAAQRDAGATRLLPRPTEFLADADYLLPLLGNIAPDFPQQAVRLATAHLRPIHSN